MEATPTCTSLFSTIAGDISVDTVNSVISDLNLFRTGTTSLPTWDPPHTPTSHSHTLMESGGGSAPSTTLHSEAGPSRDSYPEACRQPTLTAGAKQLEESILNLPLTPPTSDSGPPSADTNNHGSDSDPDLPPRKKRAPVPVDKKDDRYWERRKKNNIAAKRSRELRRKKIDDELKQAQDAIQENQKLKQEIEVLKAEINSLRRLLKDANMTLSLWIRAKQTAEPNSQLPPMLRGPNVPFVNFPVSSNV